MEVKIDSRCPNCGGELDMEEQDGGAIVLGCDDCHLAAVVGDDRWIHHKDLSPKELAAKLEHRVKRLAENEKEMKGRFENVKLTDLGK